MENNLKFQKLSNEALSPEFSSHGYIIRSPITHIIPPTYEKGYVLKTNISLYLPIAPLGFKCCAVIHPYNSLKGSIHVKSETIDPSVELRCLIFNNSNSDYIIERGDKIFQILIHIVITPSVIQIPNLSIL